MKSEASFSVRCHIYFISKAQLSEIIYVRGSIYCENAPYLSYRFFL